MKNLLLPSVLILFLASCITTTHVHYSDPNYLGSTEFSTYEEMTANNQAESESFTASYKSCHYHDEAQVFKGPDIGERVASNSTNVGILCTSKGAKTFLIL